MTQNSTAAIPYLDGWRGLAIVLVLVAHFQYETLSWLGNFGVQLFFVLSGYLMGRLLFIKEVPIKDFFARRFSRVLPTFLVFVLTMAVYASSFQAPTYTVPIDELIATLTFTRTYFPSQVSINSGDWPIGHVWSLNVEEHSYIGLALIALLARYLKRKNIALVFLWLAVLGAMFFSVYYPGHPPANATEWHRRSEAAALGLLFSASYYATAAHPKFSWLNTRSSVAALLSLSLAIACFGLYELQGKSASPVLRYTLAPILLAFSINQLDAAPKIVHKVLSWTVLRWFGLASFSLYLWQQPFYYAHAAYGFPLLPALLGALICGTASFYFWENPSRLYLNARWTAHRSSRLPVELTKTTI